MGDANRESGQPAGAPPERADGAPDTANAFAASLLADPARVVAWHEGRAVPAGVFLRHARALAARWPDGVQVVDVCEHRYSFLVAFAAALLRGGTTLLPPSRAPAVLAEVQATAPGSIRCEDEDVAEAIAEAERETEGAGDGGGTTATSAGVIAGEGRGTAGDPASDRPLGELAAIGFTSGSTGQPKRFPKRWASFLGSNASNLEQIRAVLPAADRERPLAIVGTVPSQHMYGIETTVLLPLAGGLSIHTGRPLFPAEVAQALAEVPAPRVLVTTPVHLRAIVESIGAAGARAEGWPEIAVIICATAPLDADLARAAEAKTGAYLLEMFGATETCIFAARRTAAEERWRPARDVRLQPFDEGTLVHAPWLAEPVPLQDFVEVAADGSFRVIGRQADLIEVAGKRASLADLTRRIRAVPGVLDAVAFQPDAADSLGVRRVAALVVAPGLDVVGIRAALAASMDPVFVPRPLVLVDALPRNEVGKLPRERLVAELESKQGTNLRDTTRR